MGKKIFGTDGIRGKANQYPIDPQTVLNIGIAVAHYFMNSKPNTVGHKFTVVIGKDTRLSGYMLEYGLVSGLVAVGADVILLGPVPTPAVSMLTRSLRADLGIMISASHNPFQDNGIKFFNQDGYKISDEDENNIEHLVQQKLPFAEPCNFGKAKRLEDAVGRYIEFIKSTFPRNMKLNGLKIVVDCANGATYKVAPRILWELGAEVISIGCDPNGTNINDGFGATSPKNLQKSVLENKADIGIALDGDGDRLLIVDENGAIIDGDQIMALISKLWLEQGLLKGGGVVATHMSNMGFENYLNSKGINLFRTSIGDKNVLEEMLKRGCNLGGEQSGHIILTDYGTTGDGLMAALQVLSLMVATRMCASSIGETFKPVPQVLKNIKTKHPVNIEEPSVRDLIEKASQSLLQENGRILVRKSGTESLIRIMAQGDNKILINSIVEEISQAIHAIDKIH
jgi:phosphoglucosamine mutase